MHRKVRLLWQITTNANETQNNDKKVIEYQYLAKSSKYWYFCFSLALFVDFLLLLCCLKQNEQQKQQI